MDEGGVGRLPRGTWLGEPPAAVEIFRIVPELEVREKRMEARVCTSAVDFDLDVIFLVVPCAPEGGLSVDSLLEKDFRMFPLPLERVLSALMEVVSAEVVELLLTPRLDFLTEEDELDDETSPVGGFPATRLPVGEFGRLSALSLSSEDSPSPLCPSSNTMDGPVGGWLSNAFFT